VAAQQISRKNLFMEADESKVAPPDVNFAAVPTAQP